MSELEFIIIWFVFGVLLLGVLIFNARPIKVCADHHVRASRYILDLNRPVEIVEKSRCKLCR